MAGRNVEVHEKGEFTTVLMNRPERRNALSQDHMEELIETFRALGAGKPAAT